MKAASSEELKRILDGRRIPYDIQSESGPRDASQDEAYEERRQRFEAVKRWFNDDWRRIEPKLRTSIVEGISVFLSLFDDNPAVKRTFCPPKECYDPVRNHDGHYGTPLPPFGSLIEQGKVCALNFPISANPGLARAVGTMLKQDFQRTMIGRIPQIDSHRRSIGARYCFFAMNIVRLPPPGRVTPPAMKSLCSLSSGALYSDRGHAKHQLVALHPTWRVVANPAADFSHQNLSHAKRRLQCQDGQ